VYTSGQVLNIIISLASVMQQSQRNRSCQLTHRDDKSVRAWLIQHTEGTRVTMLFHSSSLLYATSRQYLGLITASVQHFITCVASGCTPASTPQSWPNECLKYSVV